jgi:hypothetical protein
MNPYCVAQTLMPHQNSQLEANLALAKMLASRMERLSADSSWARLASGARGSLLKLIEELECLDHPSPLELQAVLDRLQHVMRICFRLLERAAQDLTS